MSRQQADAARKHDAMRHARQEPRQQAETANHGGTPRQQAKAAYQGRCSKQSHHARAACWGGMPGQSATTASQDNKPVRHAMTAASKPRQQAIVEADEGCRRGIQGSKRRQQNKAASKPMQHAKAASRCSKKQFAMRTCKGRSQGIKLR